MPKEKIVKIIELNEDLIANNERLAAENKTLFNEFNVKSYDIVGAIGAGKTAILEAITKELAHKMKILVINGDVATRIDADRIEKYGAKTIQVNTGRECALNSYHISQVLKNFDLSSVEVIFIENVGNLICPSDFILGAERRIVVVSITEGPWVIKKHPLLFKMSDIAVINKIDLAHYVGADLDLIRRQAPEHRRGKPIAYTNCKTGDGLKEVANFILETVLFREVNK